MSDKVEYNGPAHTTLEAIRGCAHVLIDLVPRGGGASLIIRVEKFGNFDGGSSTWLHAKTLEGRPLVLRTHFPAHSHQNSVYIVEG